jgi:hypothetical protein
MEHLINFRILIRHPLFMYFTFNQNVKNIAHFDDLQSFFNRFFLLKCNHFIYNYIQLNVIVKPTWSILGCLDWKLVSENLLFWFY